MPSSWVVSVILFQSTHPNMADAVPGRHRSLMWVSLQVQVRFSRPPSDQNSWFASKGHQGNEFFWSLSDLFLVCPSMGGFGHVLDDRNREAERERPGFGAKNSFGVKWRFPENRATPKSSSIYRWYLVSSIFGWCFFYSKSVINGRPAWKPPIPVPGFMDELVPRPPPLRDGVPLTLSYSDLDRY